MRPSAATTTVCGIDFLVISAAATSGSAQPTLYVIPNSPANFMTLSDSAPGLSTVSPTNSTPRGAYSSRSLFNSGISMRHGPHQLAEREADVIEVFQLGREALFGEELRGFDLDRPGPGGGRG